MIQAEAIPDLQLYGLAVRYDRCRAEPVEAGRAVALDFIPDESLVGFRSKRRVADILAIKFALEPVEAPLVTSELCGRQTRGIVTEQGNKLLALELDI